MKLIAYGDYLIVKPQEAKKMSEGGLYLPENTVKNPPWGEVVSTTHEELAGKKVFYSVYAGDPVEIDDVAYLIMHKDEIRAFVEDV